MGLFLDPHFTFKDFPSEAERIKVLKAQNAKLAKQIAARRATIAGNDVLVKDFNRKVNASIDLGPDVGIVKSSRPSSRPRSKGPAVTRTIRNAPSVERQTRTSTAPSVKQTVKPVKHQTRNVIETVKPVKHLSRNSPAVIETARSAPVPSRAKTIVPVSTVPKEENLKNHLDQMRATIDSQTNRNVPTIRNQKQSYNTPEERAEKARRDEKLKELLNEPRVTPKTDPIKTSKTSPTRTVDNTRRPIIKTTRYESVKESSGQPEVGSYSTRSGPKSSLSGNTDLRRSHENFDSGIEQTRSGQRQNSGEVMVEPIPISGTTSRRQSNFRGGAYDISRDEEEGDYNDQDELDHEGDRYRSESRGPNSSTAPSKPQRRSSKSRRSAEKIAEYSGVLSGLEDGGEEDDYETIGYRRTGRHTVY